MILIAFESGRCWKKSFFSLLALSLLGPGSLVFAEPLTDWAQLDEKNAIQIVNRLDYVQDNFSGGKLGPSDDSVVIDFMDYAGNNSLKAVTKKSGNNIMFDGMLQPAKDFAPIEFKGGVAVRSMSRLSYSVELPAVAPREIKEAFFSLRFNQSMLGREIDFTLQAANATPYNVRVLVAADKQGGWVWSSPKGQTVQSVAIPMMHGTLRLSGFNCPVMLCKYGANTGNIRIYLESGKVQALKQNLEIEFLPYENTPLDLTKAANVGFVDETADDRKGGWTDQGPMNDLRDIPVGIRQFGNVGFEVIDPAKNGGKSVLAFANSARNYFLNNATIELNNRKFDYLYLLNAAAWCRDGKVGTIKVDYSDGTTQSLVAEAGRDVADWWNPVESFDNATPIWRTQNQTSLVGLYLSRYRVANRPISKITFTTANNAVWLIVAATGVTGQPPFPRGSDREIPFKVEAGKDWKAFTFSKNIVSGSPLDFSGSLDAPAGKYGQLRVMGDRFVFSGRPEQAVRFLGVNVCEAYNYLEHADSEILADRIARTGYNAVRLHHFDEHMIKKGATSLEFDPGRLDNFFYFIAKLKERGIYVTLDLFTMRTSGFAKPYKNMFEVKTRFFFSQPDLDNFKEFGNKLLGTVNPYTKLALKDDPVLVFVGLINEDPMFTVHEEYKYPNVDPERNAMIKPVFEAWCKEKGFSPAKVDRQMWLRFIIDRHIVVYNELRNYFIGIGVKAPMSDISCYSQFAIAIPRSHFDYVDNHFYVDHPSFLKEFFKMPFANKNRSEIKDLCREIVVTGSSRIVGKPFTVTEFNFCVPNMFRSENGPIMGAIASLQDWNGIFRFSLGKSSLKPLEDGGHLGSFAVENDPLQFLGERMIAMFYLRGDVKSASEMSVLTVPVDAWRIPEASDYREWGTREKADIPRIFGELGLYQKIGTKVVAQSERSGEFTIEAMLKAKSLAFKAKAPGYFDPAAGKITSSTGEISIDRDAGTFKVATPKSEGLVVPGRDLSGKLLKIKNNTTFSTFFAGALDNLPLDRSKRILVLHLTDVKASGQKLAVFRDQLRMYDWGKFSPYLARCGQADVTLDIGSGNYTVNAIGLDGKVLKQIPVKSDASSLSFTASIDQGDALVMAYEIVRR